MSEQAVFDALKYRVEVDAFGTREFYNSDGQLHRTNGPAIEYANGTKYWYQNGVCHRTDGPAVEWDSGGKSWFIDGKLLSEAEFKEAVKHNV